MAVIQNLTAKEFDAAIQKDFVLIDFWASWCGPCRSLGALLERVLPELPENLFIGKVEIEAEKKLAERYKITAVPTLILYRRGEKRKEYSGVVSKSALLGFIEES